MAIVLPDSQKGGKRFVATKNSEFTPKKRLKNIIISPIFYMGNKKKLINKGMTDLFPKNINRFYDLFSGSAVVSMNVDAQEYFVNDIDKNLYELYGMFKIFPADMIIRHIESRVDEYGLAKERISHKTFDDDRVERYKAAYAKLRDAYNKDRFILDFYTLMFYSFSQQFRFNSKGHFNMPCGNDCFSESNKEYIINGSKFFRNENVHISNKSYLDFDVTEFNKDDFVYIDAPYHKTTAVYNENNGWTENNELELYHFCEKLDKARIKFAMSNVFKNKGTVNQMLTD